MEKFRCIFCKRSDSPASAEDVFAKWIIREWGTQTTVRRTESDTGLTTQSRGNAGILTWTPCRKCNNGWMSRLENDVKPIIAVMMRGNPLVISDVDQLVLSRWMLKTVMMYEQARSAKPYFNSIDRTNLYRHNLLPKYTRVWAAVTTSGQESLDSPVTYNLRADVHNISTRHQNQSGAFDGEAHCATFMIQHLALQLFTIREHSRFAGTAIQFNMSARWNDVALPIFPISPAGVRWPPEFVLDECGLNAFMTRWSNTGNPTETLC